MNNTLPTRQQIRQQIRFARRQLTPFEQNQAAQNLVSQIVQLPHLAQAHKVALYLANDGELDTQALINWYWARGHQVYLPVLHPFCAGHLLFLRYQPHTLMWLNSLGIAEPKLDIRLLVPKDELDIIYTPLVAFDVQGNRLGMGGGFYDRTLSSLLNTESSSELNSTLHPPSTSLSISQPRVVGLAHDCQQVAALPSASWDVPLSELITPTQHFRW